MCLGDWEDQVTESDKQDRLQRLKRVENSNSLEQSQRFIGTIQEVYL